MSSDIQLLQNLMQHQHKSSHGLLEFAPFGYMWETVNSKKLIASHTIYTMLEIEPFSEYLTVQKWRTYVYPPDLYKLLQAEEELLYTGNPVLTEYRLITDRGRYLYVTHQMHLSVLPHAEARIMSIVCDITEQKSAEIILEGMNECFFELDANFGVRRMNEKARIFWNLTNTDLEGKSLVDIFPEIEGTFFLKLLSKAHKEKISLVEETVDPVSAHWIHLSISLYSEGLIVIFFDLQNEKEAERKLLESKNLYYSLAENTPDVITRWNRELKLIYANSAFETKTGVSNESLYGKTNIEMGQPEQIATPYMNSLQKVFETGQQVEHFNSFPTLAGEAHFYSRMVPEKNVNGEVETVLAIARDITEIKRAEFRAKENKDLLQGIIDAPSAGIGVFKAIRNEKGEISDFQFEFVNLRIVESLGGNDPTGKMITQIGGDTLQYLKYFREVIETGKRNSYTRKEESGTVGSWFLFSNAPLGNDRLVQVWEDITELKKNENHVMELNKSLFTMNRELNSLNSELKTFTSIAAGNYSETLRHLYINLEMIVTHDARNLSNSGRANLRRAQGAIQKMKLVTDDLISFSKLHEIGTKEDPVDLNKILRSAISDFTDKPNHPPVEISCDHLPSIAGYPLLLPVLFHHLLDNAIKFRKADKGHIINITCKDLVTGNDLNMGGVEKNCSYSVISIADNGIGFPLEESEKIFDMFYQLHEKGRYKGSGVGLAICKKIMEMHGGIITAEGRPGEGASFHCFFPHRD